MPDDMHTPVAPVGFTRFATIAAVAVATTAGSANAAGTLGDEISRTKEYYWAASECPGASSSCNLIITTTPKKSRKKYLEIYSLSCRVLLDAGHVYWANVQSTDTYTIYEHLDLQPSGAYAGTEYAIVKNAHKIFARPGEELRVYVHAAGDPEEILCNVAGEMVKYAN